MRKKILNFKRTTAVAAGVVMLAASTAGGIASLPSWASSYDHEYNLEVAHSFQEFDGWGLTLSWWATEIGDWTRTGSSGMEKRQEIMEAIYGKSGLNLNIARYNVGGGDDPSHTHMTDDRNTPGWRRANIQTIDPEAETSVEVPEGSFLSEDGTKLYTPEDGYVFEAEDGSILSWDQTPDHRQLWVLDWIQKHRDGDLLTEYFSNSPPYWMTRAGCSSGGEGAESNLVNDAKHNEAFVNYFLDVYEYLVGQGFQLDNIQPFNEPGSYYWGTNGDQEGSYFNAQHKVDVLAALVNEMNERGLDLPYNVGDETNTETALNQYSDMRNKTVSNGALQGMKGSDLVDGASRLTYHVYSHDIKGVEGMYRNAKSHGQEVYMSEICYTQGSEYDSDAMETGFKYTNSIIDTVKYGGVDGYVFWQGVEDMVGQIKSGTNYGLIQGVYYTQEEAEAQGTDLAALGLNYQDYVLSKAYYMSGQYTKWINQGYKIIDIDDARTMAAISPDGQTLVVVKQNQGSAADSFKLNLGGFKANSVERIITDKTHNWAKSALSTDGDSIIDTVPGSSVTTYVIHGASTGRQGYFVDDSQMNGSYNLSQIKSILSEDENQEKELSFGTFTDAKPGYSEGKSYYFGYSYTNTASEMVLRFKGTGLAIPTTRKSDSGTLKIWLDKSMNETPDTLILAQPNREDKVIVYDNNTLDDAWHTVIIQGSGWVDYDGVFIYTARDAEPSNRSLAISNAAGVGGQIGFDYEATGYEGYEIFAETRVPGGSWVRTQSALSDGKGTVALNAESAELRLVAVKDDQAEYSPVRHVNILKSAEGVLYFADCGTADPAALSEGALLGSLQSVSDKAFGEDAFSGMSWGYKNALASGKTATGYFGTDEAMSSAMALENVTGDQIEYVFTMPQAGTYKVALGFFGGESSWGNRKVDVAVNGQVKTVTVKETEYTAEYFDVTTAQENETVTVTAKAAEGETQSALLSLIVITEENVKLPLYTSGVSNYNTKAIVPAAEVVIGDDIFAEIGNAKFTVYYSDGTYKEYKATDEGVSYTVATGVIAPGKNVTATYTASDLPSIQSRVGFTWAQDGAEVLYYNIDMGYVSESGTPPDDATLCGSKQSSTRDRMFSADAAKGTSWGFDGTQSDFDNEKNLSYPNDGSNSWSIRGNINNMAYKMTGFRPNESLKIETGGHCYDGWGTRAYDVKCNGMTVGNINISDENQNKHFYEQFECAADSNGELRVVYSKTSGNNPWVGYIKVWSTGANLPKDVTISADKTTVSENDKITLRNLNTEATVYVLDGENNLLGNFKPEAATAEIEVGKYLKGNETELHFVQAQANETNVSADFIVDVPAIDVAFETEWAEQLSGTVLLFKPRVAHGVTSFTITVPDGATFSLTDGFFYRAKANGEYIVKLVTNGQTLVKKITVNNIDEIALNTDYSTTQWTKDDVTLTLTPTAASGVKSLSVNGSPVALDNGKYVLTAVQNVEYDVVITTEAGNTRSEKIVVNNIDKTEPSVEFKIDFSAASGVTVDYDAVAASGGKVYVSFEGGQREQVSEIGAFPLTREGRYEIVFVSGAGVEAGKQVYYVTYGADKAKLANVQISEHGTVTVSENAKLYRAGDSYETPSMRADKLGKYYLEIENGGETEIVVFTVEAAQNGGSGVMIAGIVVGSVAIVAAGIVCTLLVLKGRKKQ